MHSDWDQSKATARGGALQVDLHATLHLKNVSTRRIRGLSVLVLAQEVTPGGKASVTAPSLDVEPGAAFPLKLDLRLMRPLTAPGGALVEVALDGVLFEDLGFFGPNRLNSRRTLTAWEMEARRDRRYLASLLDSGPEALRGELLATLSRLSAQPRLEIQAARSGRSTASPGAEQLLEFAFVAMPEAPVELLGGFARVAANQASVPRFDLRNRSPRPVRHVEVGWTVRDAAGREYSAGSLPADLALGPGERRELVKDTVVQFSRPGAGPVAITGLRAFVSAVEFGDGQVWAPSRAALADPRLAAALPPSPELQRLAELYRRKGLAAVQAELQRLR
jgi:hypothetical protein